MNFGSRLKELRHNARLTQQQLGDLLGVSKSVVSYYELGERTPSPEILVKLTRIFHVTSDHLLGIEKRSGRTIDVSALSDEEIKAIEQFILLLQNKK